MATMPDPALVLSWSAPADPHGALRRRARQLTLRRLRELFRRAAPPECWTDFSAALGRLPALSQRRLLSAPELVGRLAWDLESDVTFYLDSAHAELLRLGLDAPARGPLWTALGDARLDPLVPGPPPAADRLPQGAVIDASSPWATARIPQVVERHEAYSPSALRELTAQVQQAGRLLRRLHPRASALVRGFARVVVLRRDPDHPERFLSESTEGVIGRVVLCNAHLPSVDPLDRVEALVHESVHAWLGTLELFEPFLPDRARAMDTSVTSPWTGNELDAERLVHAVWVWYSLSHLWRQARGLPEAERSTRLARCEVGAADQREALARVWPALSDQARRWMTPLLG